MKNMQQIIGILLLIASSLILLLVKTGSSVPLAIVLTVIGIVLITTSGKKK